MKIRYFGICDVGLKRKVNQDSILMLQNPAKEISLFVVADGMGGHADGELASKAIVNHLDLWANDFQAEQFEGDFSKMVVSLHNIVGQANKFIYEEYNQNQVCGATCVLMFVYKEQYAVLNAGDSHIYLKRDGKIESIMVDDVWENQPGVMDSMTPEEIEKHPNFGKLTNAIGTDALSSLTEKIDTLRADDVFLLCSDGLYKYAPFDKITASMEVAKTEDLQQLCVDMVLSTHAKGAKDNTSVILVVCD